MESVFGLRYNICKNGTCDGVHNICILQISSIQKFYSIPLGISSEYHTVLVFSNISLILVPRIIFIHIFNPNSKMLKSLNKWTLQSLTDIFHLLSALIQFT